MIQKLDIEKAIQATAVLLRQEGKRASRLRLLKLLYIADRNALQKTGSPILGSKIVAMMAPAPPRLHVRPALRGGGLRNVALSAGSADRSDEREAPRHKAVASGPDGGTGGRGDGERG